jgi:hypothetical protein
MASRALRDERATTAPYRPFPPREVPAVIVIVTVGGVLSSVHTLERAAHRAQLKTNASAPRLSTSSAPGCYNFFGIPLLKIDETEQKMKRRIFLAMLLTCAALSGASQARAQTGAQAAPAARVTLEEFKKLRDAGKVYVLDVRYQIDKKIKGATHIPLDQLEARLAELPHDKEIVTYCS